MQKILSLLIPTALVLSSSLHAQDKENPKTEAPATESSDEPKTPASVSTPKDDAESAVETSNESEADDGDIADDANDSYILRQSQSKSVELFVDYNTFQAEKQYFTPVAYGVKAFYSQTPDLKLGLSLAAEHIYFGFDRKTLQTPGNFRFEDVKRTGDGFRVGAHAQYFLANSLNIEASIFGASGTIKKGDGYVDDYYSRSGISVAFGNQWTWHDYSFGLDWLTLTYNASLRVGGENVLNRYPSNRNGGMIVLSALSFGMVW